MHYPTTFQESLYDFVMQKGKRSGVAEVLAINTGNLGEPEALGSSPQPEDCLFPQLLRKYGMLYVRRNMKGYRPAICTPTCCRPVHAPTAHSTWVSDFPYC